MTNQELYSTSRTHLLTQMAKAYRPGSAALCAYRNAEGLKCAIGCLIPVEKYSQDLEGEMSTHREVMAAAGLSDENRDLARKLQQVHDEYLPEEWHDLLDNLAAEFGLAPQ